jgi:hypothetical protein
VLRPDQIDRIEIFTTDEPVAVEADVIAARRNVETTPCWDALM